MEKSAVTTHKLYGKIRPKLGVSFTRCFTVGKRTDVWVCRYNLLANNGSRP